MLYPGLPFTQKIRAEFRKALSSHPKWRHYRKFVSGTVPQLNSMNREQLLSACDALGIDVWQTVDASGSRWGTGRRYRQVKANADFDKRTDAVIFLESQGYVYAGGKWQKKPDW